MHDEIDEPCTRTRELLAKAVDAELSPEERSACEAHLQDCEACRSAASWLELASSLAKQAPSPAELPEARMERVIEAVMDRIEPERRPAKRPGRRVWAFAPAMTSLAALSVLAFLLLRSPQVDQLLPAPATEPSEKLEARLPTETVLRESEARSEQFEESADSAESDRTGSPAPIGMPVPDALDDATASMPERDAEGSLQDSMGSVGQEAKSAAPADTPRARRQKADEGGRAEGSSLPPATAAPLSDSRAKEAVAQDEDSRVATQENHAAPRLATRATQSSVDPWQAIGERPPESAAQADSLRTRIEKRVEEEEDEETLVLLRWALDELDRLWPQDSEED